MSLREENGNLVKPEVTLMQAAFAIVKVMFTCVLLNCI